MLLFGRIKPYILILLSAAVCMASGAEPETYDYIIVGAGTAGGFLAHRLSTAPSAPSVLLLETGPDTLASVIGPNASDNPNYISLMPGSFIENLGQRHTNYMYKTTPQAGLDGRVLTYHRGKGLGGTSGLNFMVWAKGYKGDYDEWARTADDQEYSSKEGWERIKRLENFDGTGLPRSYSSHAVPDYSNHGNSGPIHNTLPKNPIPGIKTFIDGCVEVGIPRALDANSGKNIGAAIAQMTIWKGARSSSATQCLNAADGIGTGLRRRSNLVVKVESRVDKILFEGRKAIGVQVAGNRTYLARKEVTISGGFIDSPKLLLLSGVGPKEELEKLGINVVLDSPNVGKNMLDHSTAVLDPIFKQDIQVPTGNSFWDEPDHVQWEKEKWYDTYKNGKGEGLGEMTRFGGSVGITFLKFPSVESSRWPEWENVSAADRPRFLDRDRPDTEIIHILGYRLPGSSIPNGSEVNAYSRLFLVHQNHLSRGTITLRSSDPNDPPLIDPQYFSHPYDVRIAVETVKMAVKIFRTKPLLEFFKGMEFVGSTDPLPFIRDSPQDEEKNRIKGLLTGGFYVNGIELTDAGIEKWLRTKGLDQGYHGMGTCRMGKEGDNLRVVDSGGRVVGIQGLRIADTSVVPVVMNNHPQVSAYLVADVVADSILRDNGLV